MNHYYGLEASKVKPPRFPIIHDGKTLRQQQQQQQQQQKLKGLAKQEGDKESNNAEASIGDENGDGGETYCSNEDYNNNNDDAQSSSISMMSKSLPLSTYYTIQPTALPAHPTDQAPTYHAYIHIFYRR